MLPLGALVFAGLSVLALRFDGDDASALVLYVPMLVLSVIFIVRSFFGFSLW